MRRHFIKTHMSDQSKELALVSKDDLSLVGGNALNEKQLQLLLKRTPSAYVKQRPAKGGGTWSYVTGGYVRKVLNLMFGFKWNFEIVDEQIFPTEVVVKGKLTVETDSGLIVKMQYGNKDVICKREDVLDSDGKQIFYTDNYNKRRKKTIPTNIPLSIGNDLKAACTDALKKCAAELGIAADIYNAEDFREVKIAEAQTNYDNIVDDE
jgi:hypothetical protein